MLMVQVEFTFLGMVDLYSFEICFCQLRKEPRRENAEMQK